MCNKVNKQNGFICRSSIAKSVLAFVHAFAVAACLLPLCVTIMCCEPVLVRNNSRYIADNESARLFRLVPCGHCCECLQTKMNEVTLRMHYEIYNCVSNGGYALIDCLTYSDGSLPRLHHYFDLPLNYGYKCFDPMHVRLFLVRLRGRLRLLGYNKDCFKQYYVGEFGTDPRKTKRPHYHIVFFCDGSVSPAVMSELIADCWPYGRTDGLRYTSKSNLDYNTISFETALVGRISAIASYLSKYLHKSQYLYKQSFRRCMHIMFYKYGISDYNDLNYSQRLEFRNYRSRLMPLQRYSHGFGLCCLNYMDMEYINKNQSVYFDSGDTRFEIPLPLYFRRKLFFTCKKNQFGCYSWIPNNLYKHYCDCGLINKINNTANKLRLNTSFDGSVDPVQFAYMYHFVFGRCNYTNVDSSYQMDICRDIDVSLLSSGYYNYCHPRFGLNVVSSIPIVLYEKNVNVNHQRLKISHYATNSKTAKVLSWTSYQCSHLSSSEHVLQANNFYPAYSLFLDSICKNSENKNKAFDLKQKIFQLHKNLMLC